MLPPSVSSLGSLETLRPRSCAVVGKQPHRYQIVTFRLDSAIALGLVMTTYRGSLKKSKKSDEDADELRSRFSFRLREHSLEPLGALLLIF